MQEYRYEYEIRPNRLYNDPYEGYDLKELQKKLSQGKFLTPSEKNYVIAHSETKRKKNLHKRKK